MYTCSGQWDAVKGYEVSYHFGPVTTRSGYGFYFCCMHIIPVNNYAYLYIYLCIHINKELQKKKKKMDH